MTLVFVTILMCVSVFAGGFLLFIAADADEPAPFVLGATAIAVGVGLAIIVGMLIGATP